ncbi:MAG: hypothetical protein WD894_22825 [Pirellulales bacterium]
MKNRGVVLVLLLLVAGLAAAASAIWHQYRQTRQALNFWGPEAAYLIGHAPSVELTELPHREPGDQSARDETRAQQRMIDISQARGLVHFRRSLLEDHNFDWDIDSPAASSSDWDYTVRFSDDEASLELAFDLNRHLVGVQAGDGGTAVVTDTMAEGLAQFFKETLAQAVE